jgi:protocatechuate 3,4-dioxygenase beta subunit
VAEVQGQAIGVDPPYDWPEYRSSRFRCPKRPLLVLPEGPTEQHGPLFGERAVEPADTDLTRQHGGEPIGQRIVISGRLLDDRGHPIAN